jgi:hypothetical protein
VVFQAGRDPGNVLDFMRCNTGGVVEEMSALLAGEAIHAQVLRWTGSESSSERKGAVTVTIANLASITHRHINLA